MKNQVSQSEASTLMIDNFHQLQAYTTPAPRAWATGSRGRRAPGRVERRFPCRSDNFKVLNVLNTLTQYSSRIHQAAEAARGLLSLSRRIQLPY